MDWGRLARIGRALFEDMLDAVVPPQPRSARTKSRSLSAIPLAVQSHELLHARITTLMDYTKPEVQDLIRSLKYDGSRRAARLCAAVLADYLREEIHSIRAFSPRPVFIVPLPLHAARRRERGFDQIELVLNELPRSFKDGTLSRLCLGALTRSRATPRQTHLPRSERLRNVRGAFALARAEDLRRAHVILIDDVATTGATLLHASLPLKKIGADVIPIALSRS